MNLVLADLRRDVRRLDNQRTRVVKCRVVGTGPLEVRPNGSDTTWPGVVAPDGYEPVVGDVVYVLCYGVARLVIAFNPSDAPAPPGGDFQPHDDTLDDLAVLGLTPYGGGFLELIDQAAARAYLALGNIATHSTSEFAAASHTHAAGDLPATIAYLTAVQSFLRQQTFHPNTDVAAIVAQRNTDGGAGPFIRGRNAGDTATIWQVANDGKGSFIGLDAGSQRIQSVADATAATDAMNRQFSDGRYAAISHGHAQSEITGLVAALALLAPLASPALTGNPTAPTASPGDNDTSIATTAFVSAAITALSIGSYAPLASPTLTGDPKAPTASPGDNDTSIATTAFVQAAITALSIASYAPLASPTFTGDPKAPTPAAGDNDTSIATTAFAHPRFALGTRYRVEMWNPPATSQAVGVALTWWYAAIFIEAPTIVTGIEYQVGATNAGVVRSALYDSTGARVGVLGTNFTPSAINTRQLVAFGSPTATLAPGVYYAAMGFNNNTATFMGGDSQRPVGTTVGGTIAAPTSITPPTATGVAPLMQTY